MSQEEPSKEDLEKLIRDSKSKSEIIITVAGEFLRRGQYIRDLANASEKVVSYMVPYKVNWIPIVGSWQSLNEHQDNILAALPSIQIEPVITSGSYAGYHMAPYANPDDVVEYVLNERIEDARNAALELGQVIDQLSDKDELLALMRQFGLDNAMHGRKSAIEQFEIAWAAFEQPVKQDNPVNTSHVPMRECIRSTVDELLRRRPTQEATKNEKAKMLSIGGQLARDGIAQEDIEAWANQWRELLDELSGAKHASFTREEWRTSLRKATLFLQELFQGLDPVKTR